MGVLYSNENKYKPIITAIEHYKFCASIEVTNGNRKTHKKKKQISGAYKFLKNILTEEKIKEQNIQIKNGIAFIKRDTSLRKYYDFQMHMRGINSLFFREASIEALNCDYLTYRQKKKLENLFQAAEPKQKSIYHLLNNGKEQATVGAIKGVVLEIYVKKLLDEVMEGVWRRTFTRLEFAKENSLPKGRPLGEIDLLVVCNEDDFKSALKNIGTKFDKTKTEYKS